MSEYKSVFHLRINELFAREKDRDYKISVSDYAKKLGTTRASLRGWLDGTGEPKSEKLRQIAEIEDVSVDWLVGNSNKKDIPYSYDWFLNQYDEEGQKMLSDYLKLLESRKKKKNNK